MSGDAMIKNVVLLAPGQPTSVTTVWCTADCMPTAPTSGSVHDTVWYESSQGRLFFQGLHGLKMFRVHSEWPVPVVRSNK
jgi:hypothetical protein